MKTRRLLLWLGLICFASGWLGWRMVSASAAQAQQSEAAATLKAEARLVLVDTVVTDKKGNYVHDLTQKDFKVWEDNKEQTIKSFSYESENGPSANPQRHYLVLFFDNSSMSFEEQARARDAAAKFIDNNAGPNRLMAAIEYTGVLKITQNFTASADKLKAAVAGIKASSVASNNAPSEANAPVMTTPGGTQIASLGSPGGVPTLSAEAEFGVRGVLYALRSLAKNLASVPGRKTLVMLTSGFQLTPELQSELTATIDACNKYNVAIYPIDVRGLVAGIVPPSGADLVVPTEPSAARLLTATFNYTEDAIPALHLILVQHGTSGGGGSSPGGGHSGGGAPSGGGTGTHGGSPGGGTSGGGRGTTGTTGGTNVGGGYPVSSFYNPAYQPRVIVPPFPPNASDNQMALYALASGTGGFVIVNTNDLLGGMEKIAKELSEYYVLGYTPADTPEGSCHTIKVKVERSDTAVRSRSGYCNVKPADLLAGQPAEKTLENRANGTQPGTVAASIETPYFYSSPNTARVNVAMDIPANSIKFEKVKGKQHATLNVLGIAYKPDNSVAARFSDAVNLDFENKKEVEEFSKSSFHYENQFDAASGQYTLKVVFSAGGEAFGKIETPLTVEPYDGKQFVLSSMALSKEVHRVADVATGLDAELMEDHVPLVTGNMEIVPAGTYRFKKTDMAVVYAELYEPLLAGANPPQVGIELKVVERKTGQQKFDTGLANAQPFVKAGNPVVPVGLKIPVNTLEPGSYRAELTAKDSAGRSAKARTADFEVE